MIRTTGILLGLSLVAAAMVAARPAIAAGVVAESQTSVAHPVATVRAAMDWRQRCSAHDTRPCFLSGRPCRPPLKDLAGYGSVRWTQQA